MKEILNLINRYQSGEFTKNELYDLVNENINCTANFREIEKIVVESKVDCCDQLLLEILQGKLSGYYREYYKEAKGVTDFLPQLYWQEVMDRNFDYEMQLLLNRLSEEDSDLDMYHSYLCADFDSILDFIKENPEKFEKGYKIKRDPFAFELHPDFEYDFDEDMYNDEEE